MGGERGMRLRKTALGPLGTCGQSESGQPQTG
jgi:hypothetical protein